jgi:hypothetical protein
VTAADLLALLQAFSRDKLALRERHVASAQQVSNYDFNNTYHYIINREDMQVGWLQDALAELGGALPRDVPPPPARTDGKAAERERAIVQDDAREAQAFLDKWQARVSGLRHARHRRMLQVILGETVEQRRFFDQMAGGRDDVLGRRTGGESTGGGVLPTRWLGR